MKINYGIFLALLFVVLSRSMFGVDLKEESTRKPTATHELDKNAKEKFKNIFGSSKAHMALGLVL